ncbi:hypothetical protein [Streptomyces sp. NPDC057557]|uniref:hypothetical protein n=1 Tax=Streptomyces sp. NPDC057557 TaxID=3346167 RepID=UPI0036BB8C74
MTTIDAGEPSAGAAQTEHLTTRADLFRAAHALVSGMTWPDGFGVYDVLQVTAFLEENS